MKYSIFVLLVSMCLGMISGCAKEVPNRPESETDPDAGMDMQVEQELSKEANE